MRYIDLHCDTLGIYSTGDTKECLYENSKSVDFKGLREAEVSAQFFATFFPPRQYFDKRGLSHISDEIHRDNMYQGLMKEVNEYRDIVAIARNYDEYRNNLSEGKTSIFMTFEDGRIIDGSMERLEHFYELGYRLIGLTWNGENCFGYPNSTDRDIMERGLKDFGKEAVVRMNELGMLVDVSHLSDGGFYDVANIAKKPFIASHSNARALSPHQRNLTDDMIRILADKGGVTGINFCSNFLNEDINCNVSMISDMVQHIKYLRNKGGIECISLGTDFDGISGELEIDSPLKMNNLFDALSSNGFSSGDIEKIAYMNIERVLKEVL